MSVSAPLLAWGRRGECADQSVRAKPQDEVGGDEEGEMAGGGGRALIAMPVVLLRDRTACASPCLPIPNWLRSEGQERYDCSSATT